MVPSGPWAQAPQVCSESLLFQKENLSGEERLSGQDAYVFPEDSFILKHVVWWVAWAGGLKEPARDAPCHRVNLTEDFTSLLPEPRTMLGIQQVFKKHLPEGHNKHHWYLTATRVTTLANFPQSELRRGARCRLGTSPTCEASRDGSRLLQFPNLHWWLQRTRWRATGVCGAGRGEENLGQELEHFIDLNQDY